MPKILTYTIRIEPAEEGGYVVTVPALPGCMTQGETYEEAIAMAEDAIALWVETLAEDGKPIPREEAPTRTTEARIRVSAAISA